MANHATVTQTSSTAPPPPLPRSSTSRTITPEMERDRTLLHHPSSSSRLPPIPPARPGTGIRIHSASTTVMSTAHQRVPTSPLTVPRVPAPSLPLRNNNNMSSSSRSNNSGVIVVIVPPPPPHTTTTTSTTSEQQQQQQTTNEIPISLSQPRPDGERVRNEYIDTPLKGGLGRLTPLHAETHPHIHIGGSPHDHLALVSPLGPPSSSKTSSSKSLPHTALTPSTSPALQRLHNTRRSLPITKQPINAKDQYPSSSSSRHGQQQLLNADQVAAAASDSLCPSSSSFSSSSRTTIVSGGGGGKVGGGGGGNDSIICSECNRCRCQSCRTPRPLPSKWLCGDKCLCSADSCVDYVSCLCCVKGLFYHCGPPTEDDQDPSEERLHRHHHHSRSSSRSSSSKEGGGGSSKTCADAPCSCAPGHNRLARWGCLASLSLVLPCLLCYWPLRGGVKVVEMCYQKCTQHGCQCDQQQHQQQQQQQRNSSSTTHHQQQQPLSGGKMVVNNQPVSSKRLLDN